MILSPDIFWQMLDISFTFEPKSPQWKNPKCVFEFKMGTVQENDVFELLYRFGPDSNLDIDSKLLKIGALCI